MLEADETNGIRVLVIEDQREIREGMVTLINGTTGLQCAGAYRSMEEGLARTAVLPPDVALVDIGLPGMSGIDGIPRLLGKYPELLILMLTVFEDDDRIFGALCAGACGYLLKRTPPAKLLECIREVKNGGARFHPRSRDGSSGSSMTSLRRRPRQVVSSPSRKSEFSACWWTVTTIRRRRPNWASPSTPSLFTRARSSANCKSSQLG